MLQGLLVEKWGRDGEKERGSDEGVQKREKEKKGAEKDGGEGGVNF